MTEKLRTTTGKVTKIREKVRKITGKGEVSNFGSWQEKCNIVLPHISQHPDKLFPLHKVSAFSDQIITSNILQDIRNSFRYFSDFDHTIDIDNYNRQ